MAAPNPWDYAKPGCKEHAEQVALFMWANMAKQFGVTIANDKLSYTVPGHAVAQANLPIRPRSASQYDWQPLPQLEWLHAIHNQGHGDVIRGNQAKAEGVKKGVCDVFLPYPLMDARGHMFAGLYIELKTRDRLNHKEGGAEPEQVKFMAYANKVGYVAKLAHGWEVARDHLLDYLRGYE